MFKPHFAFQYNKRCLASGLTVVINPLVHIRQTNKRTCERLLNMLAFR